MFRGRLVSQGINVAHNNRGAWGSVPEPDFIERMSYNLKYAPVFLKMILLSMVFVLTGWAVGVTTCELDVVPSHGEETLPRALHVRQKVAPRSSTSSLSSLSTLLCLLLALAAGLFSIFCKRASRR